MPIYYIMGWLIPLKTIQKFSFLSNIVPELETYFHKYFTLPCCCSHYCDFITSSFEYEVEYQNLEYRSTFLNFHVPNPSQGNIDPLFHNMADSSIKNTTLNISHFLQVTNNDTSIQINRINCNIGSGAFLLTLGIHDKTTTTTLLYPLPKQSTKTCWRMIFACDNWYTRASNIAKEWNTVNSLVWIEK